MMIKQSVTHYFYFLIISTTILVGCNGDDMNTNSEPKIIKEYYIECIQSDFDSIYNNYKENIYIPIKITFNGNTVVARMRIRGDTSREDPKKSLKIKFDSTEIIGLPKKLNLNAEYADKTYIRQYISTQLMKKSGQICYNTQHAKVFLNGKFLGLYLQVENIGKDFLTRNNLDPNGNLYKATKDGACLSIFDDFDEKWEKKTNKKSDHNDLNELIYNINNVPDNKLQEFIKHTFEYDELINILALNMFLSNSSTYYHNYYLYHDLYNTGKWKMLPWDMDKTLSYYNWMPYTYHRTSSEWESDNPLVERSILCKPIYEDIKKRIDELHKSHLNNNYLSPIVDSLTAALSEIVAIDTTDNIKEIKEWKNYADAEKKYLDSHYALLQKQFTKQPLSFKVHRFTKLQTQKIIFKWQKATHPASKPITYILSYGTDFLLKDSSKTKYITNIKDTFYTLSNILPEGKYYWKVTAFDGEFYTDGFNTKNIFEVKKGTNLPKKISKHTTLTADKSPYTASNKTIIDKGATLTIEKGVEVHLPQNGTIECYGDIIAKGTKEKPIYFMPANNADSWGHIYFYESAKIASLKNVVFKEGTINSKETDLTLNNSSILINKKFMGDGWDDRKVLIYGSGGKIHINNCTFKGNGEGEGVILFGGEPITENSYFDNIPDAIEYINVNKGVIRNNHVTRSPDDAIDLNNCDNVLIEGNFLTENVDKAISIGTEQYGASIENIQVKNNLIVRNKTAIAIKDSSVAFISNNTLFKNKYGINLYKKRDDYNVGGKAFVKNTIFEKNKETNVYPDEFSEATVMNCIVTNKVLAGRNNLKGDPKFIDAGNNNFHLMGGSPCIGKADDGNDIGAFSKNKTIVNISKAHIKSSKEKNTGDWIKIKNNYNIPFDLSKFKIVVQEEGSKEKVFIFPIGTKLQGLESLILAEDYRDFIRNNSNEIVTVFGGLCKLKNLNTSITLYDQNGYKINSFFYNKTNSTKEDLTWVVDTKNQLGVKGKLIAK